MSESAPKSLLRGMMGLAVATHGSVPVADYDLSQHGAKISQGAVRKYGVKPHPNNPGMEQSFSYDEPEEDEYGGYDEAQTEVMAQAAGHWSASTIPNVHHEGKGFREDRWQAFTASQVGEITAETEAGAEAPVEGHPGPGASRSGSSSSGYSADQHAGDFYPVDLDAAVEEPEPSR
jgi:hypothetical protein